MKKLFLVMTIVLVTIGLSGCDLISPTQIDEISEEFCRENPTSEICQGDLVGDLEDDVVLNVFNRILDDFNNTENETFCDDYFSVTNTELLDSCRASRTDLVHADYADYTPVDVTKKVTLSTDDIFEVTVESSDRFSQVIYTIGLVNVEGLMYINLWSYEIITIDPTDLEVSYDDAYAYFQSFIDDYLDDTLLSTDVCAEYFPEQEGCATERDESLALGIDVGFDGMTDEGDGVFEVELSMSDDEITTPETEFEEVTFSYDSEGNIVMEFIHDDDPIEYGYLTSADALDVIQGFLDDYLDDTITNEQFNQLYFNNMMDEEFFNDRDGDLIDLPEFIVTLVEDPIEAPLELLSATLVRTKGEYSETIIVQMSILQLDEDSYYFDILFNDYGDWLEGEEALVVIQLFLADYLNDTITNEQFNEKYFDNKMDLEFFADRDEDLLDLPILEVTLVEDPTEEPFEYLNVTIVRTKGEDTETTVVQMRLMQVDEDRYYFDILFTNYEEWLNATDAFPLLDQFFIAYNDESVLDEAINERFFDNTMDEFFFEDRQKNFDEEAIMSVISVEDPTEEPFDFLNVTLQRLYDGDIETFIVQMRIKQIDHDRYYVEIIFEDQPQWLNAAEAFGIVEMFFNDYLSTDVTDEEINLKYFDNSMDLMFFDDRQKMIDEIDVFTLVSVLDPIEEPFDFLVVTFEIIDGEDEETMTAYIRIIDIGDGRYYFDIIDDPENYIDFNEIWAFMENLIRDYQDLDLTDEYVCNLYFSPDFAEGCMENRQADLENGETIVNFNIWQKDDFFEVEFEIYNGTDTTYDYLYVTFYYDEFGELKAEFHKDDFSPIDYDELYLAIEEYVAQYMDYTIPSMDVCSQLFEGYAFDQCIAQRDKEINDGILLEAFNLYMEDNHFVIEFEYIDSMSDVIYQNFDVFVYFNNDDMLRIELYPHFNLYPYDEAFALIEQLLVDYNDFTQLSEDVCGLYFGGDFANGCVEKRNQEILDNVHIRLYMFATEFDHYRIEFEYYDLENNLWHETVNAYFWYDEVEELLKVDFHSENKGFPYDIAYEYFQMILEDYVNTEITNVEFCTEYFPWLDSENCIFNRSTMPLEHLEVYLEALMPQDGVFEAHVTFINHYDDTSWTDIVYLEFEYDEFGELKMHFYYAPVSNYLNFDLATSIIAQYVFDYTSEEITFQQINTWYFDNRLDGEWEAGRNNALDMGFTYDVISFTDPYNADGQEFLEVVLMAYEGGEPFEIVVWMRVILLDNGLYLIEQKEDDHHNHVSLNYEEALAYMDLFVAKYNDTSLDSYTVCSEYFGSDEYPYCITKRDDEMSQGIYMQSYALEPFGDEYYVTFYFYDIDNMPLYDEYVQVKFFYGEYNEIKISFGSDTYQFNFPEDEALWYINQMFTEFFDTSIPTTEFCLKYEQIMLDCGNMRESVFADDGYVYMTAFYHTYDNEFFFQYAYEAYDGATAVNISLDLSFFYDDFGNIMVNVWNYGPEFFYLSYLDATEVYEMYLEDYLDSTVDTQYIIDTYFQGYMDQEFIDQRALDLISITEVEIISIEDLYDGDGVDWITATIIITRMGDTEEIVDNFRVLVFEDDNILLEFEHYNPEMINYADAWDFFELYVQDLQDPEIPSDDFCNVYDGVDNDMCINMREELLNREFEVVLDNLYFDEFDFMWVVSFKYIDAITNEVHNREFNVQFWMEDDMIKIGMWERNDYFDPLFTELEAEFYNYVETFMDPFIDSTAFCTSYFADYPECVTLRDELLTRGFEFADYPEFYWYFDEAGMIHYQGQVTYFFLDGGAINFRFEIIPNFDDPDMVKIEVIIVNTSISLPIDAVLLDEADTIAVLTQFALDYSDPTVSPDELCILYFGGAIGGNECVEGRTEFLIGFGYAVFNHLELAVDEEGVEYYKVYFDMTIGTETFTQDGPFRVYLLTDGNHYIEFVHMDYKEVITPEEAQEFYLNFLADFQNPIVTDQEICEMYFNEFDPNFNCVEFRVDAFNIGLTTVLLDFEMVEDNYFIITLEQTNPLTMETVVFTQELYVYMNDDGFFYMEIINPEG